MAVLAGLTTLDIGCQLRQEIFLSQRLNEHLKLIAVIVMTIEAPYGLNILRTAIQMIHLPMLIRDVVH